MSEIDATAVSVVPARTSVIGEAGRLLRRDGAVIVCGHPHGEHDVGPLLAAVLGDDLRHVGEPVEVRAAGGRDRPDLDADGNEQRSPLHTDGFALADGAPDVLALGCETSVPGGDSFVVDMNRVHAELRDAGGESAELGRFMVECPIDQTEPGKRPSIGPIGLAVSPTRIVWRCSYHLAPRPDDLDRPRTQQLLDRWTALLDDLAGDATRFHLESGEVLVADNTVVFHGRDPYEDRSRLLWRVWAWTPRAARPDTQYVISDTSKVSTP